MSVKKWIFKHLEKRTISLFRKLKPRHKFLFFIRCIILYILALDYLILKLVWVTLCILNWNLVTFIDIEISWNMLAYNQCIFIFLYNKAFEHIILLIINFVLQIFLLLALEILAIIHKSLRSIFVLRLYTVVRVCCWIQNH